MRPATAPVRRTLRSGFTLVEMLVVMALIVLLAALAAGVANSGLIGSQRLSSGSNAISGWLLIAKQTAARDGAARGVRFFGQVDSTNQYLQFTSAQYIQSADPVVFNPAQESNPNGPFLVFNVEYKNVSGTVTVGTPAVYFVAPTLIDPATGVNYISDLLQRVSQGDSLILPEYGISTVLKSQPVATSPGAPSLVVNGLAPNPPGGVAVPPTQYVQLDPTTLPDFAAAGQDVATAGNPRNTTIKTYKFGFQNVPRPVLGESPLQISSDIGIDFRGIPVASTGNAAPNPTTTIGVNMQFDPSLGYYFDIVFAPSGRVLNNTSALTCLWVRDLTKMNDNPAGSGANPALAGPNNFDYAGEQLLTVIYNRSGLIATQPVAPPPLDPYLYAKDGANNGV